MQAHVVAYIGTLVALLVCDIVWLSTVGNAIYRPRLGALLLDKPVWWAAAAFYLFYTLGVVIFAAAPALRAHSWSRALVLGVMFGAFAYATYDLTNLATTRGWSTLVAGLDIAWGAALTGVGATAGYLVASRFVD